MNGVKNLKPVPQHKTPGTLAVQKHRPLLNRLTNLRRRRLHQRAAALFYVLGSATNTATVTVNLQPTYRKDNYFRAQVTLNNSAGPVWASITNVAVLQATTHFSGAPAHVVAGSAAEDRYIREYQPFPSSRSDVGVLLGPSSCKTFVSSSPTFRLNNISFST